MFKNKIKKPFKLRQQSKGLDIERRKINYNPSISISIDIKVNITAILFFIISLYIQLIK